MRGHMPKFDLPPLPGPSLENLANRYDLIRIIEDSHVRWRDRMEDPHLKEIHQVVVDRLEAVLEQYRVLMDVLQSEH